MDTNVALVIIYNHRYDKNIEILEEIYNRRFSNIFHLVPFYDGDRPNVIPVYESSYYFQGYIAQGFSKFFDAKYDHYLFVADDLILNPSIDEKNYADNFKLEKDTSFIPELITLHEAKYWTRLQEAYDYSPDKSGVEVGNELPTYAEAIDKFKSFNLKISPFNITKPSIQIFRSRQKMRMFLFSMFSKLKSVMGIKKYELSYPLVGGYSDILIVPANCIRHFCHYCGVFSATKLFVELAIPTALVLTTGEIVCEEDLMLQGRPLWTSEDYEELERFDNSLNQLLSGFPENYLYIHPIKLSGWKIDI